LERGRQTILSLVAVGRITPREAERLLAAWDAGRAELGVIAVCAAGAIVELFPGLARMAHMLLPAGLAGVHYAGAAITHWMGGAV